MKFRNSHNSTNVRHPTEGVMLLLVSLLTVMLLIPPAPLADESNASVSLYPKQLHYGVLNALKGVDKNDARVAVQMNFDRLSDIIDPEFRVTLNFLPDIETTALSIQQRKLHALSTTGIDYFLLRKLVKVRPLVVASKMTESPIEPVVLLAPKTTTLERLFGMPQRRLIVDNPNPLDIGRVWLETELAEKGLPRSSLFFTSIQVAVKPIRLVLPVFFGQAEACLVPESVYETMRELNPQIGQKMHVLLRSPGFVKSITLIADYLHPDFVDEMKASVLDMHKREAGRQLLMIFQFRRFFLFRPEYLSETEKVYQKYEKLILGRR